MNHGVSPLQPLGDYLTEVGKLELINVYCPVEAANMPFDEVYALAVERDEQAARNLENSYVSALRLEEAAQVANAELEAAFLAKEKMILAELGYL